MQRTKLGKFLGLTLCGVQSILLRIKWYFSPVRRLYSYCHCKCIFCNYYYQCRDDVGRQIYEEDVKWK